MKRFDLSLTLKNKSTEILFSGHKNKNKQSCLACLSLFLVGHIEKIISVLFSFICLQSLPLFIYLSLVGHDQSVYSSNGFIISNLPRDSTLFKLDKIYFIDLETFIFITLQN